MTDNSSNNSNNTSNQRLPSRIRGSEGQRLPGRITNSEQSVPIPGGFRPTPSIPPTQVRKSRPQQTGND